VVLELVEFGEFLFEGNSLGAEARMFGGKKCISPAIECCSIIPLNQKSVIPACFWPESMFLFNWLPHLVFIRLIHWVDGLALSDTMPREPLGNYKLCPRGNRNLKRISYF
jgi:hypothetical protein